MKSISTLIMTVFLLWVLTIPSWAQGAQQSLTQRKHIWAEIIQAERRAAKEAQNRYPDLESLPIFGKPLTKQDRFRSRLNEQYQQELATQYGLTRQQLDAIAFEGLTKGWPVPEEGGVSSSRTY